MNQSGNGVCWFLKRVDQRGDRFRDTNQCYLSASPHIRTDQGKTDNEDEATARHMQCKFVSER